MIIGKNKNKNINMKTIFNQNVLQEKHQNNEGQSSCSTVDLTKKKRRKDATAICRNKSAAETLAATSDNLLG